MADADERSTREVTISPCTLAAGRGLAEGSHAWAHGIHTLSRTQTPAHWTGHVKCGVGGCM
jgi:hypothetical protein